MTSSLESHQGNCLPAIPRPGSPISLERMEEIEREQTLQITYIDDVDELQERRRQTDALSHWLRGKELHGPMLGLQRRIEARIGQLLGEAENGGDRKSDQFPRVETETKRIKPADRNRFRMMARGIGLLSDEEWRQARAPLLKIIAAKLPKTPSDKPEPKQWKPYGNRKDTADKIRELAQEGHNARQIAELLGRHSKTAHSTIVDIAREHGILLPETVLGRTRLINAARVIDQTAHGLASYAQGLKTLGPKLDGIDPEQARVWLREISEALTPINRLVKQLRRIAND